MKRLIPIAVILMTWMGAAAVLAFFGVIHSPYVGSPLVNPFALPPFHVPEDLPRALPHVDTMDPAHRHALEVEPGSLMERVYGEGEIRVNSRHVSHSQPVRVGRNQP